MTPNQQLAQWADQLRAMAALGLRYADDVYNQERYQNIQTVALAMLALASGDTVANLEPLRNTLLAHPTPFAVGDAAVIDDAGRMLLIRRADNGRWAMPGGALDVGETAAAGVVREALEETGVHCEAVGLAGVFDSRFWGGSLYQLYQFVFLCRPLPQPSTRPTHAHEVREQGWFTETELPSDLDPNHAGRIQVVFQVWRSERPPYFDP